MQYYIITHAHNKGIKVGKKITRIKVGKNGVNPTCLEFKIIKVIF